MKIARVEAFHVDWGSGRSRSETISEDGYDVVCCVGYRQNTRGNATDLRFAAAGTIIGIGHDPAQLGNTFKLKQAAESGRSASLAPSATRST